jgi:hypothetical protein
MTSKVSISFPQVCVLLEIIKHFLVLVRDISKLLRAVIIDPFIEQTAYQVILYTKIGKLPQLVGEFNIGKVSMLNHIPDIGLRSGKPCGILSPDRDLRADFALYF